MIRRQEMRRVLISFLNVFCYSIAFLTAFFVSYFLLPVFKLPQVLNAPIVFNVKYLYEAFWALIIVGIFLEKSGLFTKTRLREIDKFLIILRNTFVSTILFLGISYLYPEFLFSKYFIILFWPISVLFILASTIFVNFIKLVYRKINFSKRKILLIGKNRVSLFVKKQNQKNFRGRHYFYPYEDNDVKDLPDFLDAKGITEVIITHHKYSYEEMLEIADVCESRGADVKFAPSILELRMGEIAVDDDFGIPLLQIRPLSFLDKNFIDKRIFDVLFSLIVLSISIFPILFVALLIKLTSAGKIFYTQKRLGLNGNLFNFYKFRTMVPDAHEMLDELKHLNEREGPVFKIKDDPRVTFIGRFLRKFSIDEFPQFYNVLRGDMSIVGPRPPLPSEVEEYDADAKRRFKVFPGITGIWQISGRSDLNFDDMINLDIYYLENWTLSLDLEIMLKTIPAVLLTRGAF
ncbi:sugar transferase [bacterium]